MSTKEYKVENFRGVSLKRELVDRVERWIKEHPESGYKNIAEFVSDATRHRIEEVKKTYETEESESA